MELDSEDDVFSAGVDAELGVVGERECESREINWVKELQMDIAKEEERRKGRETEEGEVGGRSCAYKWVA